MYGLMDYAIEFIKAGHDSSHMQWDKEVAEHVY